MRKLLVPLLVLLAACNNPNQGDITQAMQMRIDSLRQQLKSAYKPGFGELMLNIQVHHAKLWFAGENNNWPLAGYEESLIKSAIKKITLYHAESPETKSLMMLQLPMDSVDAAITRKDQVFFKRSFLFLTTTCNNCHRVTSHAFNVITVPTAPPLGNQSFKAVYYTMRFSLLKASRVGRAFL